MANQIECLVCGVMIEVDDNSGLKIECPNCHEMVTNTYARENLENKRNATRKQPKTSNTKSKKPQPPSNYMISGDNSFNNPSTGNDGLAIDVVSESKFDEDGVKKELVNALIKKDYVPSDIFNGLNIEMVSKYYLPYQLFEGVYQVPWNAVYEWNEYVDYVENGERKKLRQKRYGESNGIASGKFSYLQLVCSGDNIPPKILEKAKKKSSVSEEVVPYTPDIEEDGKSIVMIPNSDFKTNWKNKVSKEVLAKGKEDAEKQARSNEDGAFLRTLGTGVSLQNMNYQVNYDLKILQTILIPFWYIDYTYQNTHYWFVMDERGRLQELEAPKNEEEMAIVEENEKSKSSGLWVLVLLLWALSIVLGWIYSSWLVFLGLAIFGFVVAGWAAKKDEKVDNLNKEVRNENMKRRQEMAQGFLSNWSEDKESQLGRNKDDKIRETKTTGNDDYLDSIV